MTLLLGEADIDEFLWLCSCFTRSARNQRQRHYRQLVNPFDDDWFDFDVYISCDQEVWSVADTRTLACSSCYSKVISTLEYNTTYFLL